MWGVTAGEGEINANKWRKVAVGDIALFYRSLRFFHKGTVAYKVHSADLARDIWGVDADGRTREYTYFLTDLEAVDIDVEEFNAAVGYRTGNIVRGFNVLSESKCEATLDAFELEAGFGPSLLAKQEIDLARQALWELEGSLDLPATTLRRREQTYLRKVLLSGRRSAPCAICARELPVDLLVVGHIRKRHSCDAEQKRDLSNVMPVCLLGYDALFESGYVYVDSQGALRSNQPAQIASVSNHLSPLIGKPCRAWSTTSEPYFAWHRDNSAAKRKP